MIHTVHVITGLNVGGAELMLARLLTALDGGTFRSTVVSLVPEGPVGESIRQIDVPVHHVGMKRGVPDPRGLLRLARLLRRLAPDVIQTWMYHADLMGGLAARLAGLRPVVWNIRHSNLDPEINTRSTLLASWLSARLSRRLPARIVCGSEAAKNAHSAVGYPVHKMTVIPNGFDTAAFQPSVVAREQVRSELRIPLTSTVVGLVGRYDPQKGHSVFARAAGIANNQRSDLRFILCGRGINPDNAALWGALAEARVLDRCHLLGNRDDIARVIAAFDIATSSSLGEGLPNSVGEAMACGIPCVVTDVGDSARLVGDAGIVVPSADAEALANGWLRIMDLSHEDRISLGGQARQRVVEHYSIEAMVRSYERLYRQVARS